MKYCAALQMQCGRGCSAYCKATNPELTPNDDAEVEKFRAFLIDSKSGMSPDELWAKYGDEYLGKRPS